MVFHQLFQARNIYYIFYIHICETQRVPKQQWKLHGISTLRANVNNLHNRKATPQFAVVNRGFFRLWYSFPHRPRMIDTTFGYVTDPVIFSKLRRNHRERTQHVQCGHKKKARIINNHEFNDNLGAETDNSRNNSGNLYTAKPRHPDPPLVRKTQSRRPKRPYLSAYFPIYLSFSSISLKYVCVCMCMYVYVCVCICMCMYVYVCVCMCMYVYVCVCMCMYVYVCVCMCMYVYVCMYACMHEWMNEWMNEWTAVFTTKNTCNGNTIRIFLSERVTVSEACGLQSQRKDFSWGRVYLLCWMQTVANCSYI